MIQSADLAYHVPQARYSEGRGLLARKYAGRRWKSEVVKTAHGFRFVKPSEYASKTSKLTRKVN